MASPKTAGPAIALRDEPTLNCEQLAGELNQSNTPKAARLQAPPDDCGESDETFFTKRPHARTRNRLPFAGEFPPAVIELARGRTMLVHVIMMRDRAGRPTTRVRGVYFSDINEGNA